MKNRVQFWIAMLILLLILVNAIGTPFNVCDDVGDKYNKYIKVHEVECDEHCQDKWAKIWASETATAEAR